jgi:hypothetical protein
VAIVYSLFDDDGGILDVRVEYQGLGEDGRDLTPFLPATESHGPVTLPDGSEVQSDGLSALRVERNTAATFRFVWEARADISQPPLSRPVARVRLRMSAREESLAGEPVTPG